MIKYKITKSNLHIPDSYLIEKKKFPRILAQIKGIHPDSDGMEKVVPLSFKGVVRSQFLLCHPLQAFKDEGLRP